MTAVREPANTFLISDLSNELNHPAIIHLRKQSDGSYDVGFKHGQRHPLGRANLVLMDAHVISFGSRQTNGIIMDFMR
jgi:hypothetical protein